MLLCLLLFLFLVPILFINSSSFKCESLKHQQDSQLYYEQGEILWNATKYEDSIPFYRAAVRLCPTSALFWWKLGISEWKNQHYSKAIKRWDRIRSLIGEDETHQSPFIFPDDYSLIMKERPLHLSLVEEGDKYLDKISETLPPLLEKEDIDFTKLGIEEFPFVVRQFANLTMSGQPDPTQLLTKDSIRNSFVLSFLLEQYGDEETEFYPQNMQTKPTRVFQRSLREAIEFLYYPEGAYTAVDISESGTYIQWNLSYQIFQNLLQQLTSIITILNQTSILDFDLYPFFQKMIHQLPIIKQIEYEEELIEYIYFNRTSDQVREERKKSNIFQLFGRQTHWYMVLIGEENAGMFHHEDNLPVGSWQLQLEGQKRWSICVPSSSSKPEKQCYGVTLNPGDLLFYPKNYSHQTRCLSNPTISISGTIIPSKGVNEFFNFLCDECENHIIGYKFHQRICSLVEFSCDRQRISEKEFNVFDQEL